MKSNVDATLRALRARLIEIGYDEELPRRLLSIRYPDDIGPLNHAATVERIRTAGDAATLAVRFWFLEDSLSTTEIRRLLGGPLVSCFQRSNLIQQRGGRWKARLRIDPVRDLFFLADRRFESPDRSAGGWPRADMVYPPSVDSLMMASAIRPANRGSVLDLCTGSGVQGLLVARHAGQVTAVDRNVRAVTAANQNAQWNDCPNFQAVLGDLYAPVRGKRFDLILANPPFVPAPTRGPSYHSGGPLGDRVLRRVVQGLESHLAPAGRAFMISHLALRVGETVESAVRPWAAKFAGRLAAFVIETGTPIDLAAAQSMFALDRGIRAYETEFRSWVAFLKRHRVEQVVLLILVAERTGTHAIEVVDAAQRSLTLPVSAPIEKRVADWLGASEAHRLAGI